MSLALEQRLVGASLHDVEQFKRHVLNPHWFEVKESKEIITTLIKVNGNFSGWTDLIIKIKEDYPFTKLDEKQLEKLSFKHFEVDDYKQDVKLLKKVYHERKVKTANEIYGNNPTKQNLLDLKDCIRELEELDRPEDDGNLLETAFKLEEKIKNGTEAGILTYPHLDNILGGGFRGGMLITIGAGTGVGKTAFTLNLVTEMMNRQKGVAVDFFTLEMNKEQMLNRFLSRFHSISSYNLRDPKNKLTEEQQSAIMNTSLKLADTNLRVHDSIYSLSKIEKQIRRRKHEVGDAPYIPIIDYIGLIDVEQPTVQRYLQVGMITRTLKMLTNELNIPIIALSQLSRGISHRQDKTPTLADLRESGSIEQDSNVVMFLHRNEEEKEIVHLTVAKNREGFLNTIDYRFHGATMYFEEVD